jgi:hypothetical protein
MKTNPSKVNECDTDINDLVKDWDEYEIIDESETFGEPKLRLIESAGEKNDGERQEIGLVNLRDLIALAQTQLKENKN